MRETFTKSLYGDSSKPTSVYCVGRADNPLRSSIGIKRNYPNGCAKLNIGLDDISFTGSYIVDDITYDFSIIVVPCKLKAGLQCATTTRESENLTTTNYANVSLTLNGILMVLAALRGQQIPQTQQARP